MTIDALFWTQHRRRLAATAVSIWRVRALREFSRTSWQELCTRRGKPRALRRDRCVHHDDVGGSASEMVS